MKTLRGMFGWLTKVWPKMDDTYAWANIEHELNTEEIERIYSFCEKKGNVEFALILVGINKLRPQRTWCGLPEWFRSNTSYHYFAHENNSFVFISCVKNDEEGRQELIQHVIKEIQEEVPECAVYGRTLNNEKEN